MSPVPVDPDFVDQDRKFNTELYSSVSFHRENHGIGVANGVVNGIVTGVIQDNNLYNSDLIDEKPSSTDLNESCSTSNSLNAPDFSDACLKFLSDILLEENLEEFPGTEHDYRALQATEKSLYDVLGQEYSPLNDFKPSLNQRLESSNGDFGRSLSVDHGFDGYANADTVSGPKGLQNQAPIDSYLCLSDLSQSGLDLNSPSAGSSNSDELADGASTSPVSTISSVAINKGGDKDKRVSRLRRKKNHHRDEDADDGGGRSNKQQASTNEDYVEMRQYDDVLLCREDKDDLGIGKMNISANEVSNKSQGKGSKGKTTRGKKQSVPVEEVDLRTLLTQCAQAVSSFDLRAANERLKQIRQHSSPYGDSTQRLAHYFANGLEARLAGTGSTISANIVDARISSSDFLKAYRVYVSAIPVKRMAFFIANNTVMKLAGKATRIHIIDFGVLLGLQWPCLIQNLAKRPGVPPKLRITGIDFPQQGFRPAERVEATGRRLAGYCERFNVPFQYQAITQKWDSIRAEDINVEDDELVIVNCMFRSETLLDETVEVDSQKDAFLKLIKQLNPRLFIHGVVNGTFNAPFFITRFREALFHYSSIFDIFEETIPREDHGRLLVESEVYAKEALNVIACEGAERIQRPETYKQWQVRTTRAGMKQIPVDRELLGRAKAMVKANYHKDFVVDEDRNWMLQGWKGRTICALSLWQPM
nr:scarecrow-like protein 30 [Haloxylon ammodendron]